MLDAMRMRTACFARAPQRCTSRLSKHFFLTFQEVTPPSKTRNQLTVRQMPMTEGASLRSRVPQKCAPCHAQTELQPEVAGVQGK